MTHRMIDNIGHYNRAKDNILFFRTYHPWGDGNNPEFDRFSQYVLDVKMEYGSHWLPHFVKSIQAIITYSYSYVISVMPSHEQGIQQSGIRKIAEALCRPPLINGTDVIVRNTTIPKKTSGGPRTIATELPTLSIEHQEKIRGMDVFLLDDVTKTGTSLNAGRMFLKRNGARVVACFALGKAG